MCMCVRDFMNVNALPACVMCTMWVPGACVSQKRPSEPLGLELHTVVSHSVQDHLIAERSLQPLAAGDFWIHACQHTVREEPPSPDRSMPG